MDAVACPMPFNVPSDDRLEVISVMIICSEPMIDEYT